MPVIACAPTVDDTTHLRSRKVSPAFYCCKAIRSRKLALRRPCQCALRYGSGRGHAFEYGHRAAQEERKGLVFNHYDRHQHYTFQMAYNTVTCVMSYFPDCHVAQGLLQNGGSDNSEYGSNPVFRKITISFSNFSKVLIKSSIIN